MLTVLLNLERLPPNPLPSSEILTIDIDQFDFNSRFVVLDNRIMLPDSDVVEEDRCRP